MTALAIEKGINDSSSYSEAHTSITSPAASHLLPELVDGLSESMTTSLAAAIELEEDAAARATVQDSTCQDRKERSQ